MNDVFALVTIQLQDIDAFWELKNKLEFKVSKAFGYVTSMTMRDYHIIIKEDDLVMLKLSLSNTAKIKILEDFK